LRYFDFEKIAREAGIPTEMLEELRKQVRQDFPHDEMLYELHLLRACMAIKSGALHIEEVLRPAESSKVWS